MIPAAVSGFFGMNVPNGMEEWNWAFPVIIVGTIIVSILGYLVFKKKNMF